MNKQSYQTPVLKQHGSLEAITHGGSTGWALDANFPRGTNHSDLTFS